MCVCKVGCLTTYQGAQRPNVVSFYILTYWVGDRAKNEKTPKMKKNGVIVRVYVWEMLSGWDR